MATPCIESAAALARHLVRSAVRATLATCDRRGAPYAALVLASCDHDAAPLLLLSDLAEHTRQLRREARVALMVDETAGLDDPLSGSRCTVLGRIEETAEPRHRRRFLARHPSAARYAGFSDFRLYRLAVERAHVVAGFARAAWVEQDTWHALQGETRSFADREVEIVAHMNAAHARAVRLCATRLLGLPEGDWRMTGLDPEGCDLRLGARVGRLTFAGWLADAGEARPTLLRAARGAPVGSEGGQR